MILCVRVLRNDAWAHRPSCGRGVERGSLGTPALHRNRRLPRLHVGIAIAHSLIVEFRTTLVPGRANAGRGRTRFLHLVRRALAMSLVWVVDGSGRSELHIL